MVQKLTVTALRRTAGVGANIEVEKAPEGFGRKGSGWSQFPSASRCSKIEKGVQIDARIVWALHLR
jgi:hypothetical protein